MSAGKSESGAGEVSGVAAQPLTVAAALQAANQAGIDRLDAQLMLADLLDCGRTWLLANDDARLDPGAGAAWAALVERRSSGEPLAYVLKRKEFFGLLLHVSPDVLIPRADTETLVDWALSLLQENTNRQSPAQVIDLGCGSGAIALALKSAHPAAELTAVDASQRALAVAAANAGRLGLAVNFSCSDWWAGVGASRFDLAVANPPYIAEDDPHLADLQHEPAQALVAADNGIAALRQIVFGAPEHLRPGAWLLLEHGYQQAQDVASLLHQHGFDSVRTRPDLAGQPRCTGGRWPGQLQESPEDKIAPNSRRGA